MNRIAEDIAFAAFLHSQRNKKWVRSRYFTVGPIQVYLRAGPLLHPVHWQPSIGVGIANITIDNPEDRGKGYFRDFIMGLEQHALSFEYQIVRVEQTHNETLAGWLVKHGYRLGRPALDHTYVKDLYERSSS